MADVTDLCGSNGDDDDEGDSGMVVKEHGISS